MPNPDPMETNLLKMLFKEREIVADALQNEISQSLASVLLWIQYAVKEHQLQEDNSLKQAEANLRAAINRARALHYSLLKELPGTPPDFQNQAGGK
jgi:nitrate/nitrite-specific signal transduction histidine kinase